MTFPKKLDIFVLKKFLWIFFGSFFITLFVFMMQFTWRYVNDLVGKGLTMDILGKFFWYMAIALIPTSLPLAVLLAALISFGNMGEQLELLSMKAAGVKLLRIMAGPALLSLGLMCVSFYFQNKISPAAYLKLRTLVISIKQTSPAMEIPEGTFYNGIPNLNLYVERKDVGTGMLYNVMVYKTDQGFDKAQIVVADSGRIELTPDRMHLVLDIWNGEQFENLESSTSRVMGGLHDPYDRESFGYKRFIIDFDSNFALLDENALREMPKTKDLKQIETSIDSVQTELDSVGHSYYKQARERFFPKYTTDKASTAKSVPFDSLVAKLSSQTRYAALQQARVQASSFKSELEWKKSVVEMGDTFIRKHQVEWNQKFTVALACLFFFFIGAPLGAIIGKGGLGVPAVVSVLIFILYYTIDTSGMKMARDGKWNMIFGTWISSAVLAPLGAWLTYKANNDSVVFNKDLYVSLFKRFFGIPEHRNLNMKEVIIDTPRYAELIPECDSIARAAVAYREKHKLWLVPNYKSLFFKSRPDNAVEEISQRTEALVEEASNAKNLHVIDALNDVPILNTHFHKSPFASAKWNKVCGIVFPVGIVLWLRCWIYRLRLNRDLRSLCNALPKVRETMKKMKITK